MLLRSWCSAVVEATTLLRWSPDDGAPQAAFLSGDPRSALAAAGDGATRYIVGGDADSGGFVMCLERDD